MTQIFIAIVFLINGTSTLVDGWMPWSAKWTMAQCNTQAEVMISYYLNHPDKLPSEEFKVFCLSSTADEVREEALGYGN